MYRCTSGSPAKIATSEPKARNGTERDSRLAGDASALARAEQRSVEHARQQRDQHRRSHRAAEEQAHHARELDVAHAHPARVGERRQQQRTAGGRTRDQAGRLAARVERESDAERQHGAKRGQAVGDDAVLDVDQHDRYEQEDEDDIQSDRRGRAAREHRRDAQQCAQRLDERVARGDRCGAVATAAS